MYMAPDRVHKVQNMVNGIAHEHKFACTWPCNSLYADGPRNISPHIGAHSAIVSHRDVGNAVISG